MRTIRHSVRYEADLKQIFGTVSRADEIVRALEWFIARSPERGNAVRGLDPHRYASWLAHAADASIQVVYRFDDETVECLAARVVPRAAF